jgi:hypothetical protein
MPSMVRHFPMLKKLNTEFNFLGFNEGISHFPKLLDFLVVAIVKGKSMFFLLHTFLATVRWMWKGG